MKIFYFILAIIIFPLSGRAEDPSKQLEKYIEYYQYEYQEYLDSKYTLQVSEYYLKRVRDVKAFGIALGRKGQELVNNGHDLKSRYYLEKFKDGDITERLTQMRAVYFDLLHQKNTLDQYQSALTVAQNSEHLTCSEEHLTEMSKRMDPELMYTIPQYVFDPSGAPKLDMNYYFSMSYNYGNGFDAGAGSEGNLNDDQGMLVYGGAAVVTGVAMCFGVVEPTTLSLIFAGTAAVLKAAVDFYTSIAGSEEYVKQMKKLERKYQELNALIANKHKNVSALRSGIIQRKCQETVGLGSVEGKSPLPSFLDSLMMNVNSQQTQVKKLHDEVLTDLENEEKKVYDQIVSSKEFFRRHSKIIGELYLKQMDKLFEYELQLDQDSFMYFISTPAATWNKYQNSILLKEKMNHMDTLWSEMIIGDSKYNSTSGPQSINWRSMGQTLKNSVQLEIK